MKQTTKITLAESLNCMDIPPIGAFAHTKVLDLRCMPDGTARPIEEPVLKRLRNHFVEYEQLPMILNETGPCQEVHLCETIREQGEGVLVLSDDTAQVATLLGLFDIPFEANVFYVVETGRGDITKPMPNSTSVPREESPAVALTA